VRRMKKLILFLVAVSCYSPLGFSWGKIGHRVVGEIAQKNLSNAALKAVKDLAGDEELWKASTWPDEIRSDPKRSATSFWHYVSIPTGKTYLDQKRNKDGDVIEALYRFEDVLRNEKASKEERLEALRFIVHFLGDLHQPLHVGLAEDRGGNSIRVKWFKDETNLHQVWDEALIDFEQLSYTEYANALNHVSSDDRKEWEKGTFVSWAQESQDLRPKVYDIPENKNLSYEYSFKVKPVVELRLKQAGIRLAYVLNRIFSKEKMSKEDLDLHKKILENI